MDLDRRTLADALVRRWGIAATGVAYLPVGFGSHHWEATADDGARWFVTADDLRARQHAGQAPDAAFAALDRAFRTAAALRDAAGLEFVVAPIASAHGEILHRLDARYTVRVEPFVDGGTSRSGEFERVAERRLMGTLLGRLHSASARIPAGLTRREDFALPGRAACEQALVDLDAPWNGGPFAEPLRELLRTHAGIVRERLAAFDRAAARARVKRTPWVVTHGEPHSANVIRPADGGLRLVDWDTALVAPRERDLWMVLDPDREGWAEYAAAARPAELRENVLELYRERWVLAEICEYVAELRLPHEDTADARASWDELRDHLA